MASVVFGRLFDEEDFVGKLKPIIEGRSTIEQSGLFEEFSITDPVDCQRPLLGVCDRDIPFLAPLHQSLIEKLGPVLNLFIDRLVGDESPLASCPGF